MEIKEFDKVRLKSGEKAFIVHIWEAGVAYIADVTKKNGKIETLDIEQDQIEGVL